MSKFAIFVHIWLNLGVLFVIFMFEFLVVGSPADIMAIFVIICCSISINQKSNSYMKGKNVTILKICAGDFQGNQMSPRQQ